MSTDFYQIQDLLTDEQRSIARIVAEFVRKEIQPGIEDWTQASYFPKEIFLKLGALGVLGATIPNTMGGAGLDQISHGIICLELERGDSGIRSAYSVQSSLAMGAIWKFGSAEQKKKWIPAMAIGKKVGCFGLTEPDSGSDPAGMKCTLTPRDNVFILHGSKMWITNASLADVAVVWAKNKEGKVQGILVERGVKGFTTPEIQGKWSMRASLTGELVFDQVVIPKENILPAAVGLKPALQCLDDARYGIAWGAIGAAIACYEAAVSYAKERTQFGKPIASFQLIQEKLAKMLTEITKAQLLCWRLGILKNEHKAIPAQISLAKRNNVMMALEVARESRQIAGAMGITGEMPFMRHMMNLESVLTYEGTHDIHTLILGNEITGIAAFK